MLSAIGCLFLSLAACFGAPTVTEDQLRTLIKPLLDSSQSTNNIPADAPALFASLAAVSPLDPLALEKLIKASTSNQDTPSEISPANQQLGELKLRADITKMVKNALGSLRPPAEVAPTPVVSTNYGNNAGTVNLNDILTNYPTYPSGGGVQALPAPVPARPTAPATTNNNNMFNPFSLLFPGFGGGRGSPFGMLMPGLMLRMIEPLMEFF